MRIITGSLRGRRLHPPANIPARPTTDIAKTALFNIIGNSFDYEDVKYLDLFSGTGAISLEMYSRGCRDITMIDLSPISVNFQKKVVAEWNLEADCFNILRGDAIQYLNSTRNTYDLIFAGPPYALEVIDQIPDMVIQHPNILSPGGWFVLETSHKHNFSEHPNLIQVRNYGQTHFWIFAHHENEDNDA